MSCLSYWMTKRFFFQFKLVTGQIDVIKYFFWYHGFLKVHSKNVFYRPIIIFNFHIKQFKHEWEAQSNFRQCRYGTLKSPQTRDKTTNSAVHYTNFGKSFSCRQHVRKNVLHDSHFSMQKYSSSITTHPPRSSIFYIERLIVTKTSNTWLACISSKWMNNDAWYK